ncbi:MULTISPECIES: MarR family transcriptional regulator [Muribaculum]|uniref:MarR family transcriptional regulator n=1 Tax=Muribaculum TaxID=1918540 RepID=UPI001093C1EF|nr:MULTISPECIES: helix-turn-helix domain-containing protein [Muribaculum]TGY05329.1 winged helix-turn-helix domain-containing protein [Muribaculum sp. NM65_B17]THG44839.1 winged helix-turn-helix domain-containing protein [Muribaculaceae bacterium]
MCGTLNGTLNDTERVVLDFIQSSPGITANLLIEKTNKSVRTIRRSVKSLIDKNFVEYRGSKKTGGHYIVPESQK